MDNLSPEKRSEIMSRIKSKNTKPEITLRSLLHKKGFRFRIHRKDLPGNPDIVFPSKKVAIYVHGCFWHFHKICRPNSLPKSNVAFWDKKFKANMNRDKKNLIKIKHLNWKAIVVWECEIKKQPEIVLKKIQDLITR